MSPPDPAEILRAALPAAAPLLSWSGLSAWLEELLGRAQARWPSVGFREPQALQALARALLARQPESLARLCDEELLLASACASGDPAALAAVDRLLTDEVARAVRPLEPGLVADVGQLVRERLFVGQPGRIADYSGDGPLGAWLRAVSVRVALNARRPGAREQPMASTPDQPLADPDPELALLRARYRASFRQAFAQAVAALTPRQRTVLRLSALDGLTLARIGAMYGKDASTISRWLEQTRLELLASTRSQLGQQLAARGSELESLMRAADHELSVSLARLLSSSAPEP